MSAQDSLTHAQVREELSRVLASRQFADSPRLSRFLAYVVERTLAQDTGQVKEYTIGLEVFDRPADFDPRLDTIVRVQASKLRTRLNDYNIGEVSSGPVKIRLPRGSYVPVFEHEVVNQTAPPEAKSPAASRRPIRPRAWWAVAAIGLAALVATFTWVVRDRPHPAEAQVVRFDVAAPSGSRFIGPLQMSSDGRRFLASLLRIADSEIEVYIHNLESGTGEILPDTNGGMTPYWLPDGKSIVFSKAGNLYRLDLGGGARPIRLGLGGSDWGLDANRTGAVLIGDTPGPVYLVRAGGGLTPITAVRRPQESNSFPRFLPDGNRFLYLSQNRTPGESAIYVGSLDSKVSKRLLESDTKAQFVPSQENPMHKGNVLFVRGGQLLVQAIDLDRLEVTGPVQRIASGVPQLPYGLSTFSAATRVVAYATAAGMPAQLTWFDRAGKAVSTLGPVGEVGDPVLSPDGSRVAYDQAEGSNRDIWTAEVNSGKTTRITFHPEIDHTPIWSPDGGQIAFESHREPPGLYVSVARGGAGDTLLLAGGDGPSDWSPDGRFLLFESTRSEPMPGSVYLLPMMESRNPRRWLKPAVSIGSPVLSPNRKWIAYISSESGRDNVYVQKFDANRPPGEGKWMVSVAGGSQAVWRNDSKELFYLSPENVLMAVTVTAGDEFNYSRPVPLFDPHLRALRGPRNDYTTRDGKRFLFRVPAEKEPGPLIKVIVNWQAAAFGN